MCFVLQNQKNCVFFKPDLISKLHLLKPKTLLSIVVITMVIVGKGKGNVQWPKYVGSHHYWSFFFYLGLLSRTSTIHRITMEGGGYLFNSPWGTKFFGQRIYGKVILNGRTNDQIMARWRRSFKNDKYIFQ